MTSRYEDLLLPEQRDAVVGRVVAALKSNGRLSTRTVNNFRAVLKSGKPIPGFNNDPIKAPTPALKQHLNERLERYPEFAQLVGEMWAETEPQLRDVITEHLDSLEPQTYEAEEMDGEFWDTQVTLLAEKNGDYEEDDILLMTKICYAHAGMKSDDESNADDVGAHDESAETTANTAYGRLLADVLDHLRTLPAESSAWDEEIPQLAQALNDLMADKEEERNRLNKLLLEKLQNEFSAEIKFFGRSAEDWNITNLATSADTSETTRILEGLKSALESYCVITERASTLAEERERRERRHELEDTIEGTLTEIDALVRYASDSPTDIAQHIDATPYADTELQDELRTLKEDYDSLLSSNETLKQSNDSISNANRALRGEVAGLEADKQTLAEEVAELKDQLRISEANETNWRNAYEAEVSNRDSSAPEPIPSEIKSVKQAIGLARERYGSKLLISLNKKSDPDYNYNRPKEVWDALEWLATTYHRTQTGEARVIDLNESIKNTCGGWEYKPNQTDITFNTYREWYTTTKDGNTYELRKHIGKGISRGDGNIIRIAFAWDEDTQRVVIGYIGPHQRNRSS